MKIKTLILNKLNSKKGSALLLAMLFSLMCIILGMVVLSAGEASNGRIVNAAKAEQSYRDDRAHELEMQKMLNDALNGPVFFPLTALTL